MISGMPGVNIPVKKHYLREGKHMKWIAIIIGVALLIGAFYIIMTKGGALEMQQEHAVEAPASSGTHTAATTTTK